ncbi:MAG: class A beta-lactamase, subclass A2 [Candidatus Kapaibacterium sp.]
MAVLFRSTPLFAIIYVLLSFFSTDAHCEKDSLRAAIERIAKTSHGKVGVALLGLEDGDTLSINGNAHFPMQSVYKFPLAMYILHLVDSGKLSLDQKVHISKRDLPEDTWSPLREKYPKGNIDMRIGELLQYSVSKSDNNVTDVLFRLAGGPKKVQQYIRSIGIQGMAIAKTEQQMHDSWNAQFQNWCEPLAMMDLLKVFYRSNYLSFESSDFLMKLMTESENSPKRIRGLLPPETVVAHKSGTSNTNDAGVNAATNDAGIITLPKGMHLAIVVYVSMSNANYANRESFIAQIAKAAWDYYSQLEYRHIIKNTTDGKEKR